MSAADRLEDSFPHGTVDGYDAGCRGVICPAAAEHGLSCQRAKQLAAGDYQYQKLAKAGATPLAIAEALGLHPVIHRAAAKRVAVPDDEFEIDEPEEAPMEAVKVPTPRDVAPKPKPAPAPAPKPKRKIPEGPSQSEMRAWARENGLDVNPRGSVRADVVRAYLAAHAPILSKVDHVPMVPVTAPFVGARGWLKHDDGIVVVREVITTGNEQTVMVSWLPDPRADDEDWAQALTETSGPFPADDFTFDTFPGGPPPASIDASLPPQLAAEVDALLQVGTAATVSVEEALEDLDMRREFTSPPEHIAERDAVGAALDLVLRKWAGEKDRADALQRALDDERARLGSFARMLSSYQEAATADGEHIASLDEQIRDLTDKVALLSIPWWQRRAS